MICYSFFVCFAVINQCNRKNPCLNTTCKEFESDPYYMCGDCPHGKHGFNCDIGTLLFI